MNPPGAPADDKRLRALAGEVRQDDWPRLDNAWERFRGQYGIHARRDTGMDAHAFLVEAFLQADHRGLVQALATELIKEDLVTDKFAARLLKVVGASAYELQAFQGGVFRPVNALIAAKDLLAACEHVCRIDVEDRQSGTGVQVSQTLVATAAHVVWELVARRQDGTLDLRADGSLRAAPGSLGKLTLTFGDVMDYLEDDESDPQRRPGEVAPLHPDWLAWGSQPTDNERAEARFDVNDIAGIDPATGPWDLALIRLAAPRRAARPTRLLGGDTPSKSFQIHILHHPHGGTDRGEPLLWSIGQLDAQLGAPPVRCLHDASTLRGSSGAPVYDARWRVVALHQGGDRVLQSSADAGGLSKESRNRAVPIRRWRDRLEEIERSVFGDVPYLTTLSNSPDLTPSPYPVIGRRETQRRIWRAMQPHATAASRLLIIRGAPGTGLRFTKRLVREFVTAGGGVMGTLNMANALNEDAAGFAERAAGVLSAQLPRTDAPQLTTVPRSIRSELVPSLGEQLEQLAHGRATWLVLEGFGEPGTEVPTMVKDLIIDLIGRLDKYPSLRLVLAGWVETPAGDEESVEELLAPTAEDIAGYFAAPGEMPDADVVAAVSSLIAITAGSAPPGYPAALRIVAQLTPLIGGQIEPAGDA